MQTAVGPAIAFRVLTVVIAAAPQPTRTDTIVI